MINDRLKRREVATAGPTEAEQSGGGIPPGRMGTIQRKWWEK